MKVCKSCKKEIDNKAKKCPHCTSDQRIWFAKHPILTTILVLIIIGMMSSGSDEGTSTSDNNNASSENSVEESTSPTKDIHIIGETFSTGKMDFTLNSVNQANSVGSQYFNEEASEGATLVVVQYKYKNTSDEPLSTYTQPSVKLIDSSGTEYDSDLGKTSTYKTDANIDEKFLSDLNPEITVNGAQVFEVGKESYSQDGWQIKVSAEREIYIIDIN